MKKNLFFTSIFLLSIIHSFASGISYSPPKQFYKFSDSTYITKTFCDRYNNVFVTGFTYSHSGVATDSGHLSGGSDAFIAMFDNSGKLKWSRYYGGESIERPSDISVSSDEKIYIAGLSLSKKGIAFGKSWQDSLVDTMNAFIASFDTTGKLLWGTYIYQPTRNRTNLSIGNAGFVPAITNDDSGNVIMVNTFYKFDFEFDDSAYI